ncbi:MAG: glycosyltransferase family 9 protein [Candidatus Goldiibacteriota bacterium]
MKTSRDRIKIGVLKADNIGDAVLASPFFYGLRRHYKNAEITGILSPAGEQVLGGLGVMDNIEIIEPKWLSYKKTFRIKRILSAFKVIRAINRNKFDILIGMRYQDRLTSFILSLSNAKEKIGYNTGGMGFGITGKMPPPEKGIHESRKNMMLLYKVCGKMHKGKFGFSIDAAAEENVKKVLAKGKIKKFTVIHPVSGHASKDWGIGNYKILSKILARRGKVIIIGGKNDPRIREFKGRNIVNLAGMLTIRELGALIRKAEFVIGNDSAAVHIAGVLDIKSLTLFSGAADPKEWAPAGKNSFVMYKKVSCSGCGLLECDKKHECMDFDPEDVIKTIRNIRAGRQRKKMIE